MHQHSAARYSRRLSFLIQDSIYSGRNMNMQIYVFLILIQWRELDTKSFPQW